MVFFSDWVLPIEFVWQQEWLFDLDLFGFGLAPSLRYHTFDLHELIVVEAL